MMQSLRYVAHVMRRDLARTTRFRLNSSARKHYHTTFQQCQTLNEHFAFADKMFGMGQIKTEILDFLGFARQESPGAVCEIGTHLGGNSFLLSQGLPSATFFVGVDLYVQNKPQLRFFSQPSQQMEFVDGSSYSPRTVGRVRRLLGKRSLDLLFIDGDHRYDGVKRDFLHYRHLLREGGVIAFHDIVPDHRTRFGAAVSGYAGDVPRFWSRIRSLYPSWEFIQNPDQDGFGIGAIRYTAKVPSPETL